ERPDPFIRFERKAVDQLIFFRIDDSDLARQAGIHVNAGPLLGHLKTMRGGWQFDAGDKLETLGIDHREFLGRRHEHMIRPRIKPHAVGVIYRQRLEERIVAAIENVAKPGAAADKKAIYGWRIGDAVDFILPGDLL